MARRTPSDRPPTAHRLAPKYQRGTSTIDATRAVTAAPFETWTRPDVPLADRVRSLARFAAFASTILLIGFGLAEFFVAWIGTIGNPNSLGFDFWIYQARTTDWLHGDGLYLHRQLTGLPYQVESGDSMYPPILLYLTVPFALGVPALLWWAIPVGLMGLALYKIRPPVLLWPVLALIVVDPRFVQGVLFGNPSMWALALISVGTVWAWPFAMVILKPTLLPFALLGAGSRRWWIAAAVMVVLCLPFGTMWADWITAIREARLGSAIGLDYILGEAPMGAIIVLVAWASRPDPLASLRSIVQRPLARKTQPSAS
jgi:hypothetical protein